MLENSINVNCCVIITSNSQRIRTGASVAFTSLLRFPFTIIASVGRCRICAALGPFLDSSCARGWAFWPIPKIAPATISFLQKLATVDFSLPVASTRPNDSSIWRAYLCKWCSFSQEMLVSEVFGLVPTFCIEFELLPTRYLLFGAFPRAICDQDFVSIGVSEITYNSVSTSSISTFHCDHLSRRRNI